MSVLSGSEGSSIVSELLSSNEISSPTTLIGVAVNITAVANIAAVTLLRSI